MLKTCVGADPELVEEKQIHRYKQFRERILHAQREEGHHTNEVRDQIINCVQKQEADMSRDKIQVGDVIGPVNIKSRLEQVTQTVNHAPALQETQRQDMAALIAELQACLPGGMRKGGCGPGPGGD
jgi:hypothetical protein